MYRSDETKTPSILMDVGVKAEPLEVPAYLQEHYWWAYLHPKSDRVWDQDWVVNSILWGNYAKLSKAALATIDTSKPVRCLQIACAYGDITTQLAEHLQLGASAENTLDVIDIVPKQLDNMLGKLPHPEACRTHLMNSEHLSFVDAAFDHALIFFLLHEQPEEARRNTLREALRVLRPGGKLTVVDFGRPDALNPIRLWLPILGKIEPFAWDLWKHPVSDWLPSDVLVKGIETQRFFGGWFQCVTICRGDESMGE